MTTLLERRIGHQCAAPTGEGRGSAMEVCGAETEPGQTYCAFHRRHFYYPLNAVTLGNLRKTVIESGKRQRMALPYADPRDD